MDMNINRGKNAIIKNSKLNVQMQVERRFKLESIDLSTEICKKKGRSQRYLVRR